MQEWRPYEPCRENEYSAKINRAWNAWTVFGIDYGYSDSVTVYDWGRTPPGNHEDGRRFWFVTPSESSAEIKLIGELNKRLAAERERQELDEMMHMTSKQWSRYIRSPGPLGGYQIPRKPSRRETATERGTRIHQHLAEHLDGHADRLRRFPTKFDLSDV